MSRRLPFPRNHALALRPRAAALGLLAALALAAPGLRSAPVIGTVFYDMPAELLPAIMPEPTAQLAAVAGYPDDPARLTFIARLYLPDPALHGPGPYPTVIFLHGTGDSLLGITNQTSTPIAGTVYPVKQVLSSAAQAATLGLPNPIVRHHIFDRTAVQTAGQRVGHSFDLGTVAIAAEADQDTANESPNQKARRLAREEVLRWLDFKLGPAPALAIAPAPGDPAAQLELAWPTRPRLRYALEQSDTLAPDGWTLAVPATDGTGAPASHLDAIPAPGARRFYRLRHEPVPLPAAAPEHAGFFKTYADFGL